MRTFDVENLVWRGSPPGSPIMDYGAVVSEYSEREGRSPDRLVGVEVVQEVVPLCYRVKGDGDFVENGILGQQVFVSCIHHHIPKEIIVDSIISSSLSLLIVASDKLELSNESLKPCFWAKTIINLMNRLTFSMKNFFSLVLSILFIY